MNSASQKTLRKHGTEYPYRPLHLRGVIAKHAISVEWLATQVKQDDGQPMSRTALSFVLNFDYWPKRTNRQAIVDQVEAALRVRGVPAQELAYGWKVDDSPKNGSRKRYGRAATMPHRFSHLNKPPKEPSLIPEKEMLTAVARKHFQIFRDPFNDEIRGPEDLYMAADQRYIREAMYVTARQGGFIAVIGESGAGKTTLRLDLIARIQAENLQVRFVQPKVIDKKKLTARMICQAIVADIAPSEKCPQSLEHLARKVERVLTESYKGGNRHVLLIEESQDLEPLALKHLKRFYELQVGYVKLLSVILVGQPELRDLLDEGKHHELREVIRRCEIAELQPLDGNVREYLTLKFDRAGKKITELFTDDAFAAIVTRLTISDVRGKSSMVYPLVVNNITTKAMNLAAKLGEARISAEVIKEV